MTYFTMKHTHEMDIVNFVARRRLEDPNFSVTGEDNFISGDEYAFL